MTTYLFFDIETISNEDFFHETASDKQKVKKEIESDFFLPAIYHEPIAISCLYVSNDKKPRFASFWSSNTSNVGALESKFFEIFYKIISCKKSSNYPVLVSHNGLNFDLPVLTIRATKNYDQLSDSAKEGLKEYFNDSDKWEKERANYTNKTSKFNVDMYKIWNFNLKSICSLFGIEAKSEMDGSEVKTYYNEGKHQEIARYCAEDVLALAKAFNKYLISRGEASLDLPENIEECEIKEI